MVVHLGESRVGGGGSEVWGEGEERGGRHLAVQRRVAGGVMVLVVLVVRVATRFRIYPLSQKIVFTPFTHIFN